MIFSYPYIMIKHGVQFPGLPPLYSTNNGSELKRAKHVTVPVIVVDQPHEQQGNMG